jgi:hypothetical protein
MHRLKAVTVLMAMAFLACSCAEGSGGRAGPHPSVTRLHLKKVPDACTLVTAAQVKSLLGVDWNTAERDGDAMSTEAVSECAWGRQRSRTGNVTDKGNLSVYVSVSAPEGFDREKSNYRRFTDGLSCVSIEDVAEDVCLADGPQRLAVVLRDGNAVVRFVCNAKEPSPCVGDRMQATAKTLAEGALAAMRGSRG